MAADLGEYRSARERADWRGAWTALHGIDHPDLRAVAEREWWQKMDPKKVAQDAKWWCRPSDGEGGFCKSTPMRAIEIIHTKNPYWAELGQRRILEPQMIERIDMSAVRRALCEEMIDKGTKEWMKYIGKNIEVTRDVLQATEERNANKIIETLNQWANNVREIMTDAEKEVYNYKVNNAIMIVVNSIRGKDVGAFASIELLVGEKKANAVWAQLVLEAVKEVMREGA